MTMASRARRLVLGLETLLGRRRGFFIPHRYARDVTPTGYPALRAAFEAAEPAFREVLAAVEAVRPDLQGFEAQPPAPRFDQGWFPPLDAAAAYALVRAHRPRRIVEIGSGHSTRFLARAIRDGGLETRLTAIDPRPRAALAGLPVDWRRVLLQAAPGEIFAALAPGDVLFVDSSHVMMPGTDVDRVLNDLLPRLPAGLLLHLHDIVLPDPYPDPWSWRAYNEQQAVAPLIWTGAFELVFASHWIRTRRPEWLERSVVGTLPRLAGAPETSLWLRKRC